MQLRHALFLCLQRIGIRRLAVLWLVSWLAVPAGAGKRAAGLRASHPVMRPGHVQSGWGRAAQRCALMLALLLLAPALRAQTCSPYKGQVVINEVRVASSGRSNVGNQVELYNLNNVSQSVWSTWSLVVYYQQTGRTASSKHNFKLATTGITANGRYIFNSNFKLFLANRNGRASDIALLDASGAFIDYVALDFRIQTVPACMSTPAVVDATSSGGAAGRAGRATDGGSWPAAVTNTSTHNIGSTNNCSTPGNDVVVTSSVDAPAPIVGTTTTTYTIIATNKNCSGNITGTTLSVSGISGSNFTALSSSATAGTPVQGASALTWTVGTLAAGASATLTVSGKPSKVGSLTTTASLTAPTTGLVNTGDDSASSTIVVGNKNFVGFNLLTDTVTEGTDTSYTVTISSNLVASQIITVNYSVSGTATSADTDLPASGSVTIDPTSADAPTETFITFTVKNDSAVEADKTIRLTITSVSSTDAQVALDPALAVMDITLLDDDIAAPHHLELRHASGQGLTCRADSVTVVACADATCSSLYLGGISGTLSASGGTVNWPSTAAFSIASGSSSTTVSLQSTTTTATVLGVASSTPTATNAASCNFGSPACTFSAADSGFVFDVPHHVSDASQTVNVSAVRKSDNATVCVPAFASTSKAVTFSCGYTNPTTGSLPVRVGGTALNAGASAAAACDAGGRAVSLAFNASGVASTTVQYADVGQVLLSARYAGASGTSEAGLVMTGSDSFIAAPARFSFSSVGSGPIKAGSSFSATVSALNSSSAATPNFGRETSAESLFVGLARIQPTGSGAANGSFSGSFGGFASGGASATNLAWTEVGRGDLVVRSTNASGYLGTGLLAYGSSAGAAVVCSTEGSNCVLPGATTATVYYGERGSWVAKAGQTGTVACNSTNFGDPLPGVTKQCLYVATSATTGSMGDFIPHRFSVAATPACGAFSYAGQPISTTVTAQNAAGTTTVNFNGTATTTPSLAQAVTLADATGLGVGSLGGASIAATAFSAGVASATPSYSFTSKTTAPQSLVLRATNGASGSSLVSSQGYTEPSLALRSGRLRLSNAFGKATAALQVPVVTEYWGGSAWQLNSADSCTALAGASVALSNPRGASGAVSTATTSAGAVAISGGNGSLTLAAPSPAGSSLSLDLAMNLGSAAADQSCNSVRPATAGAGLAWLRAQNGSCSAIADRDPAARASFGIFAPETRKTVHVRDLY